MTLPASVIRLLVNFAWNIITGTTCSISRGLAVRKLFLVIDATPLSFVVFLVKWNNRRSLGLCMRKYLHLYTKRLLEGTSNIGTRVVVMHVDTACELGETKVTSDTKRALVAYRAERKKLSRAKADGLEREKLAVSSSPPDTTTTTTTEDFTVAASAMDTAGSSENVARATSSSADTAGSVGDATATTTTAAAAAAFAAEDGPCVSVGTAVVAAPESAFVNALLGLSELPDKGATFEQLVCFGMDNKYSPRSNEELCEAIRKYPKIKCITRKLFGAVCAYIGLGVPGVFFVLKYDSDGSVVCPIPIGVTGYRPDENGEIRSPPHWVPRAATYTWTVMPFRGSPGGHPHCTHFLLGTPMPHVHGRVRRPEADDTIKEDAHALYAEAEAEEGGVFTEIIPVTPDGDMLKDLMAVLDPSDLALPGRGNVLRTLKAGVFEYVNVGDMKEAIFARARDMTTRLCPEARALLDSGDAYASRVVRSIATSMVFLFNIIADQVPQLSALYACIGEKVKNITYGRALSSYMRIVKGLLENHGREIFSASGGRGRESEFAFGRTELAIVPSSRTDALASGRYPILGAIDRAVPSSDILEFAQSYTDQILLMRVLSDASEGLIGRGREKPTAKPLDPPETQKMTKARKRKVRVKMAKAAAAAAAAAAAEEEEEAAEDARHEGAAESSRKRKREDDRNTGRPSKRKPTVNGSTADDHDEDDEDGDKVDGGDDGDDDANAPQLRLIDSSGNLIPRTTWAHPAHEGNSFRERVILAVRGAGRPIRDDWLARIARTMAHAWAMSVLVRVAASDVRGYPAYTQLDENGLSHFGLSRNANGQWFAINEIADWEMVSITNSAYAVHVPGLHRGSPSTSPS
jgi:hypothetical protein